MNRSVADTDTMDRGAPVSRAGSDSAVPASGTLAYALRNPGNLTTSPCATKRSLRVDTAISAVVFSISASAICDARVRMRMSL